MAAVAMNGSLFTNLKFYLVPLKIPAQLRKTVEEFICSHGGTWILSFQEADYVLTALKSASRLHRHIVDHQKEVIEISSDEELPRQMRWDDIIDMVEERYGTQLNKRSFPTTYGARRKKSCVREEEDPYQTTSSSSFESHVTLSQESNDANPTLSNPIPINEPIPAYECQRPTSLDHHNRKLVEIFEFLEHARELQGDVINTLSYRKAAAAVKAYPREIKSAAEASKLKGIGKKSTQIIDDFLQRGITPEIDFVKQGSQFQILERFWNIHGVGPTTAREWFHKGYQTMEDVVKHETLSREQKLGIQYYNDFKQRLSRSQVETIVDEFSNVLRQHWPQCQYTVCGSYRRGKSTSGDVDIIMSHPEPQTSPFLLSDLLDKLREEGYIADILSVSARRRWASGIPDTDDEKEADNEAQTGEEESTTDEEEGSSNNVVDRSRNEQALLVWRSKNDPVFRRVDLVVAHWEDYPMAILGWTGSKQFERSLRLYSKREKSLKVTSHGIFSHQTGEKLPVKSEKHAFELLGLSWLDPMYRNC
ncbi:uncharacterized protein BYT42DRAFT_609817 [Radiomyces spectabilis]|uniref:uncharacterized protein n=1 Tax=Radiomyces spectabilis TaxID=64574 RepID=UPI002220F8C8|nr:uncharacterized protein BYT42DRAFT_609817 [Radiomyces spectabilis]KAI8394065.1 hypothetical protein BYT42DRAFT_609817 [Radiomyces spectabilis]